MDFANLFTKLSAVEEDVKSPGRPGLTRRNETEGDKRSNGRKRKAEQTSPYAKRQRYQAQTVRTSNATVDDSKVVHNHVHGADSGHAGVSFPGEVIHNHDNKADHGSMRQKGQSFKTINNHNANSQREQKNKKKKGRRRKNQHQQNRGRPPDRGGSHHTRKGGGNRRNTNDKQAKRTRFMTQEFKDQNVLMVDGRLLCRHFLWGRCIKGDDCQLEHIQGYNNLVKELCKFYVQGLCTKGASCPYMHESFPCKFFHRKGKCSQGADCRFSHEPLNDVTSQLLDEAIKRDNELCEQAKKAEKESSGPPVSAEESETNRKPDIFLQPLRPYFYQSADTHAEKEALFCATEEVADILEEADPPYVSDAAQPHSPPSANLNPEEPVCYSVEAVLGPQISKPFASFLTTPRSKEFAPLSSSDCTSGSANQSQVPYSVDAVLRSCESEENSTFDHTPTPRTAQSVSYTPKTYAEEVTHPLLTYSETQSKKVLYLVNTRNSANSSQEKSLPSLQVSADLISKTCPNLPLVSRDHKKQDRNVSESLKPAQETSHDIKLLSMDSKCLVNCKNEASLPFGPTKLKSIFLKPPSQTSVSKRPTQLEPSLSVPTSDSQPSFKPFCPTSSVTEFKVGAAVSAEPVSCPIKSSDSANRSHSAAKQPIKMHLDSKETQPGLIPGTKHNYSTKKTTECSSKMTCSGDLAVGCKKRTMTRPFHSLFAGPISDTLQPMDDSVGSYCSRDSFQSPRWARQSTENRSNCLKTTREPDKAPSRSFLSLFAAPLSAAPPTTSCVQQSLQSVDNTSHSSDFRHRGSSTETLLSQHVSAEEISHPSRSPEIPPNPKILQDSSTEHINHPTEQEMHPTSPAPCADSQTLSHTHGQLPDISAHKASAVQVTTNSVLKTLFLSLSPYEQDEKQQDSIRISSETENKDENSTGCVFVKQQRKSRKKGR
uniref:uncharacterized protein LOC124066168 n=1 Tax=Scatophagus argus TaxID=75038 RepID=UPI001ED80943|nr:uncharacterized protein LOC124066168 [Scatophagus argus]XP_046258342.1 uncharacterized protein LOC124066168 [Scatophagus argus]XP_046258351.1 uncharacterized protein LOC124066168 [Scatophagus argus]